MLTKMKDIFRLPSSPFSLGKTSFKPVTAKPIKIPARRLSAASHEGLAKPFLREETATDDNDELVEESEEDEANGSDQNEQVERENEEDFSEEERGDEMNSPQERVQLTESPLVEASEDEDLESSIVPRQTSHDISGEALVTIPPPTTQARKRRLSIQNGENTGKRKKSRKSELAKGKPTIADTDEEDATPSQALSKRERKEARRRKREQKAERKMARDSTVAASQDLKSVHSVKNQTTVVAAPKSIKSRGKSGLEIPSSPEQPSLRQVSPELSSITEKTQAENSSKKHKKATLETPNEAEQLNPSPETQEPTPEQTHQDPKTSKKPAKKPKTSRKTPTSIDRTPTTPRSFTRSSLSAIRIVDSSASEDELSNPSPLPTSTILPTPKPRRRKVGDLVHLQSPEIGDRKQTPSDGKQTPSKVKKFSPEEDGRLRHIIKQYKESENISDQEFLTQLDDEAGKFIEELKREEWDGRRPRSLLRRVRELVDDTTLVKGKGPYTTHENDIVDRTVLSYRKTQSMTSEQFCTFLVKDVQQDYRQRQSRILCEEIADKLPGRTTLSVTRHLVKRFSVESYPAEWTPDDDEVLRKLVVEFGNQWTVIAGRMGRSAEMTRLRYRDYVSVRFRKEGRWENDEMEVLYDCVTLLLKENGWTEDRGLEVEVVSEFVDWGSISLKVGQRSRLQCRAKWADLENWREIIGRGD